MKKKTFERLKITAIIISMVLGSLYILRFFNILSVVGESNNITQEFNPLFLIGSLTILIFGGLYLKKKMKKI